jgi:hypothetical protein
MSYREAIERAIEFRLRAKKEADEARRGALVALAEQWEHWADNCRALAARGEPPPFAGMPPRDL